MWVTCLLPIPEMEVQTWCSADAMTNDYLLAWMFGVYAYFRYFDGTMSWTKTMISIILSTWNTNRTCSTVQTVFSPHVELPHDQMAEVSATPGSVLAMDLREEVVHSDREVHI